MTVAAIEVSELSRQIVWFSTVIVAMAAAQPVAKLAALKGQKVPDFVLRDLNGRKHPFKNFRGKVVLLNFWSPH